MSANQRRAARPSADRPGTGVGENRGPPPKKAPGGTGRLLLVVHLNNMLHNLAMMMNQTALPFLTKSLGVGNRIFGAFTTTTAIAQLIGSPLFGRFGDVYGGRLSLTVSFLAMTTVSLMLAACGSIPVLFLTRLPLLFIHIVPSFQMVVSDVTDDESRAGALGLLGLSMISGIVLGALSGGMVTEKYSPSTSFLVAALLSVLSTVAVWFSIPTQTKQKKKDDKPKPSKWIFAYYNCGISRNVPNFCSLAFFLFPEGGVFDVKELQRLLRVPGVAKLLGTKFLLLMSCMIIQSILPVILTDIFQMGAQDTGIFFMASGIMGAVFQVAVVGPLSTRFKDKSLILLASFLIAVAGLLMAGATTVRHMYFGFAPHVFGNVMFDVVINSALSKAVPQEDTGAVMGFTGTVYHLSMVMSPLLSAIMLENLGFSSLGLTSSAINGLILLSGSMLL
ncbi:PREDICTED: solute carrier family 22 member 18-like [Branchiostoma belcheri]|uniref:Solute carrier family 22 member 18-like n=1 Tax=Branchiostoma belcheri TaxID=7741 RepID=A0A6P4Z3P1_BRABE|nr:PREDICTED: solute carrier family 22 member 18-like [Branchiostoma belcheri]